MTDEEKASDIYEICLDRKSLCCIRQSGEDTCDKCKTYQMFKVGLEAGKPKWHDLRKNLNDVPTEKGDYWVIDADGDYSVIYVPVAVKHCNDADMYKALNIIAWCELPKFEG